MPIISRSHSEFHQDTGSVRRLQLTDTKSPILKSPAGSGESLSISDTRPVQATPGFQGTLSADAVSPERGRSSFRRPLNIVAARAAYPSPISPDRFIPKRDFDESPSTPYRVNKHPQQLSPRERLLRCRLPGEDPFLPTSPTRRSPAQSPRLTRPRQSALHRPRFISNLTFMSPNRPNDFLRQVSSGGTWGVGGTSAMLGASVPATNGAPSLLGRRTTAPNFVARFLPKSTKADEQNKHESRIALALDIDPTTRLVRTCRTHMERPPGPTSPDYERFAPFVWNDSSWKKGNREHCKFLRVYSHSPIFRA